MILYFLILKFTRIFSKKGNSNSILFLFVKIMFIHRLYVEKVNSNFAFWNCRRVNFFSENGEKHFLNIKFLSITVSLTQYLHDSLINIVFFSH